MADTYTTGLNFTKPEGGASQNTWGAKINANYDILDTALSRALDGQCYLLASGAQQITLQQGGVGGGGNALVINNVVQYVPNGGIVLNTAGLATSTTHYVYAYMNSGTMVLEATTTGYTKDSFARLNKTGDTTRRLVGLLRVNGSGNVNAYRGQVISYFNRQTISSVVNLNTGTSSTSPSPLGFVSTLSWANGPITMRFIGTSNQSALKTLNHQWYVDLSGNGNYAGVGNQLQHQSGTPGAPTGFGNEWAMNAGPDGWANFSLYGFNGSSGSTATVIGSMIVETQG